MPKGRSASAEQEGGEGESRMTLNDAIMAVWNECPNEYAKSYAAAAMQAAVRYGTEGLRVQVQYVLANTRCWRGERARRVKAALRAYLEGGEPCRRSTQASRRTSRGRRS